METQEDKFISVSDDYEVTLHKTEEVKFPFHLFIYKVLSKLPDLTIIGPPRKHKWISTEDSEFKYADNDSMWINIDNEIFYRSDYHHRYHISTIGMVCRVYLYNTDRSEILVHGKMVSKSEVKKKIESLSTKSKIINEEIEFLNKRLSEK